MILGWRSKMSKQIRGEQHSNLTLWANFKIYEGNPKFMSEKPQVENW
jgi:hypothetical protein